MVRSNTMGYDGVHEMAVTPNSRMERISNSLLPTPNGMTVAPVISKVV